MTTLSNISRAIKEKKLYLSMLLFGSREITLIKLPEKLSKTLGNSLETACPEVRILPTAALAWREDLVLVSDEQHELDESDKAGPACRTAPLE